MSRNFVSWGTPTEIRLLKIYHQKQDICYCLIHNEPELQGSARLVDKLSFLAELTTVNLLTEPCPPFSTI